MTGNRKEIGGGSTAFLIDTDKRAPPVITVDYEKYEHFLENADLSEDRKREFIETLWRIIVGFVDLGFGVHPAQQAQKTCGKLDENAPEPSSTAPDKVEWEGKFLTENFEQATDLETEPEAEGVSS